MIMMYFIKHASDTTAAIFIVILLQEYKGTNVISCVTITA